MITPNIWENKKLATKPPTSKKSVEKIFSTASTGRSDDPSLGTLLGFQVIRLLTCCPDVTSAAWVKVRKSHVGFPYMGGCPKMDGLWFEHHKQFPIAGCFVIENPMKMTIWGYLYLRKPPYVHFCRAFHPKDEPWRQIDVLGRQHCRWDHQAFLVISDIWQGMGGL